MEDKQKELEDAIRRLNRRSATVNENYRLYQQVKKIVFDSELWYEMVASHYAAMAIDISTIERLGGEWTA